MEYICKKCNVQLYENLLTTLRIYESETSVIFDQDGEIGNDQLPDYFVLECPICKEITKINFMEYFRKEQTDKMKRLSKIRLNMASESLSLEENERILYKTNEYEEKTLADQFDEARGHSYCGYCEGFYDGDGYCNNGVKELCIVRRKKHSG